MSATKKQEKECPTFIALQKTVLYTRRVMQQRLLLGLATCVLFVACQTAANDTTYRLTLDEYGQNHHRELALAAENILERRLAAMGVEAPVNTERDGDDYLMSMNLDNQELKETLTSQLAEPFTFRIMKLVPLEEADVVLAETEGYKETGVTEEHVEWLSAERMENGTGQVTIEFTQAGRDALDQVFQENVGGYLGLFVRDIPAYKLLVETDEVQGRIVITDIPEPEFAEVFADDANVGLHVTFEPVE